MAAGEEPAPTRSTPQHVEVVARVALAGASPLPRPEADRRQLRQVGHLRPRQLGHVDQAIH
eukprot:6079483-Lingulodinium_polyedra.AAC.1